ncbi:zinc-dependent metalloprotease [Bdellovibrio sp. HCB209]|uniref:zinc-dependent metalloprotease n=1 Tax=Bdellovibrio sp. HCB209 TaxID=3394354 RepID=UPI0039B39CA9
MHKLVIVSLAFLLFTAACTKQRDAQFATGQGENLLTVAEYNGKTFEITTTSSIEGQKRNFSRATQIDVKAKSLGDDSFSVVAYEVNDPLAKKLLGDTAIVGKKNMKYKGLIRVEQNYLKVYKVAPEKDLPINEVTYATKLESGELAVPLIGYPITSRLTVDRVKNEMGEKTSTKYEHNQEDISNATQFRMDLSRGEIFEAVVKTDILPADYFEGEWYYNETITSAPEEDSESLGQGAAYDQTLTPSTRIKFLKNETDLKVVNLNIDQRLIKKEDVNFKTALTIPVEWKSYKVTGNGTGMAETEDGKVHWSKRPYLSVGFGASRSLMNSGEARLVSLEVKDDYLSYAVENNRDNIRTRYSFMRVKDTKYQPKRLFKDDKRQFGYFETERQVVQNYEVTRQEDVEKNLYISRFNPGAGKIVYHFTKTTPQWIRPYVREAIKNWDDAFKAAGSNVNVLLDETQDVELGDLRYNAINIIENLTASNLFGFGPSVTDPFTGEIISATTNVHYTPIREAVIDELRTYIDMKLGRLNEGRIVGISGHMTAMTEMVVKQAGNAMQVASDYVPMMKGLKLYTADDKNPNKFKMQNIDFRKRTNKNAKEFDVAIASGNIHKEIEAQCSSLVDYVATLKKTGQSHNENEIKVLDDCSRKIAVMKFMGTLTHELGHNFGLRHNFMGSNDSANFWSTKESGTEHQVRSSSVMEYPSFNEDRLLKPGKYDIAAIRFGYVNTVEASNGSIVTLDTNKTIAANLSQKSATLRPYKFCTDEDVSISADPMCQRHDAGVTPVEVVRNIIADYQASYQLLNFRRDSLRNISPNRLMIYRASRFFFPLSRFYEEWRIGLARYIGQDEQYLERMTEEQLDQVIAKMSRDPQYSEFVKQYRPVATEVFNFLMEVATLENKYCVLTDEQGIPSLMELEKVRNQMFFTKNASIRTCAEAQNQGFWANQKLKLFNEIGYELSTFRFDLSAKAAMEPLDVVGTQGDRLMALAVLTDHTTSSYNGYSTDFRPSFMDEPAFRKKMQETVYARVTSGVPGSSVSKYMGNSADSAKYKEYLNKLSFPRFSAEQDMLTAAFTSTVRGAMIPGKEEESASRLNTLRGVFTRQPTEELMKGAKAYAQVGGGYFVVVDSEAKDAIALVNKFNSLQAVKSKKAFDAKNANNAKVLAVVKGLPSAAQLAKMTLGEVANAYNKAAEELGTIEADPAQVDFLLGEIKSVMSNLNIIGGMKEKSPEQFDQFMKMNSVEFTTKYLNSNQGFQGSDLADAAMAANDRAVKYYDLNRVEVDAQINLLSNLILTAASI